MTKKFAGLLAIALILQAAPVLAQEDGHEGGHKGKMFEKHDTNGDGVISKDEFLSHSESRFQEMDVNGDGSISKEEGQAHRDAKRERYQEFKEKRKTFRENSGAPVESAPEAQ